MYRLLFLMMWFGCVLCFPRETNGVSVRKEFDSRSVRECNYLPDHVNYDEVIISHQNFIFVKLCVQFIVSQIADGLILAALSKERYRKQCTKILQTLRGNINVYTLMYATCIGSSALLWKRSYWRCA